MTSRTIRLHLGRRPPTSATIGAFLLAFVLLLIAPAYAAAATYYVDRNHPQASDSNPGTEALPWRTIYKATNTMVAGDTTFVKNGIYTENDPGYAGAQARFLNSGTAGSKITLSNYQGHSPVIEVSPAYTRDGLHINGKSHLHIIGLEIRKAITGIYNTGTGFSDGMLLDRLHIHDISIPVNDNVAAIQFDRFRDSTISNGIFHDVRRPDGTAPALLSYNATNVILEGNEIYGLVTGSGGQNKGIMHKNSNGTKGLIIRRNVIHDISHIAILYSIQGGGSPPHIDQEVYENIIYNVGYGVAYDAGTQTSGVNDGLDVYNNVFDCSGGGVALSTNYTNVRVWNNIFLGNGDVAIEVDLPGGLILSNFNDFWQVTRVGRDGSTYYTTLTAWQAHGFDANSLNSDPLFVSRAERDYHLQSTSPARGAGRVGGLVTGAVVDMGAYPSPDAVAPAAPTNLIRR